MASQRPVESTDEWAELELLLEWPEQVEYERIRPAAIFGSSVAERYLQTGTPETTLRRTITSFKSHVMRGWCGSAIVVWLRFGRGYSRRGWNGKP